MFRTMCMVCRSSDLQTIIDLGMHPFADTFIPESRLSEPDLHYPLACDLCLSCGHIQSRCETDPVVRYSDHDYSYTSSNSTVSRAHWENYAGNVSARTGLQPGDLVVEVGSNDGYLLEQFRRSDVRVLGIDASPAMQRLAAERGIETLVGLFGPEMARKAKDNAGPAKLVVANNVLNHSEDVVSFVAGARDLLASDGTFIFELPYWPDGIRDGHFDQIYHEHVSYLTARSSDRIVREAGLAITDVELISYHGGSIRVYAKPVRGATTPCDGITRLIQQETGEKIFDPAMYRDFMAGIQARRSRFLEEIHRLSANGVVIVAVGAAAKGNTLLNYYRLDPTTITCVTDSSPLKQGKYTPGTRIPIRDDKVLAGYGRVAALILSWNLTDVLKRILHGLNPQISFLQP
ncbi:class I SAM-dependent methyltransferase [Nitrospirales bacterium NOB]|nr:class I SAM-dependent methyltransferase [Nitrospirales bacterium NOB]